METEDMNAITKTILAAGAAISVAACSDPALQQIDSLMAETFPAEKPGAAIAVMKGGKVVFVKGYGLADMQTKAPVTPDTFFCLASVSKQFTAVAALQAAERGELCLDDPVSKYFPQFTDPIWDGVKIKHLLSHSSGLPDARSGYTREEKILADDNRALEYFDTLDWRRFEPGTSYEYINPTFVLVGRILENLSGLDLNDYMRRNIFDPAGMDHSIYFEAGRESLIPNMAHGYEPDGEGWAEYDYGEETFFATRADGALYTSVNEFVKWEQTIRSNTLISEASRQAAQSPQTLVSGSPYESYNNRPNTYYGYGWFIEPATSSSGTVVYHTGENGGFHNIAARYPDTDTFIVLLSTRADWGSQYDFLQTLESILGL